MKSSLTMPSEKHWYLAVVKPNLERKLAKDVLKFDCEAFVPLRKTVAMDGDKATIRYSVINPGFLYVRATEEARQFILRSFAAIYRFLPNGRGGAAIIPDSEIDDLRRTVDASNASNAGNEV